MDSHTRIGQHLENVPGLAPDARNAIEALATGAAASCGDDLDAIVLYGSAAEGKLRATSDVNLLIVLKQFAREGIDPLREPLRLAQAIANVRVMFVLERELPAVAEAFATKFADISRRHLVLYGRDPVAGLEISRAATIAQVRQSLLNLILRLRERYAVTSLREEQLALVLAEMTGPLRVAAATILGLRGTPAASAKEALATLAAELNVPDWQQALERLSTARETRLLPPGTAADTHFTVMALADGLYALTERL